MAGRPTAQGWLVGAEARLSIPFVEPVPRALAVTLGVDLGAVWGDHHAPATPSGAPVSPTPPSYTLDARFGVALGLRARLFGFLSLGLRAGYSTLFSQVDDDSLALSLRHLVLGGLEVGVGTGALTLTGAFDLLVGLDGLLLPLLSVGLCV